MQGCMGFECLLLQTCLSSCPRQTKPLFYILFYPVWQRLKEMLHAGHNCQKSAVCIVPLQHCQCPSMSDLARLQPIAYHLTCLLWHQFACDLFSPSSSALAPLPQRWARGGWRRGAPRWRGREGAPPRMIPCPPPSAAWCCRVRLPCAQGPCTGGLGSGGGGGGGAPQLCARVL